MIASQHLPGGFADPVHDSQQAFRSLIDAMARPGQVRHIGPALPGVRLGGAMARLLLTLADDETAIWWQHGDAALANWLGFHTGATLAARADAASFAVLTDPQKGWVLSDFAVGSTLSPDRSTTLMLELPALEGGPLQVWRGPGIEHLALLCLPGLPAGFWAQWQANHAGFPQGVDLVFTCGESAMGLPRSTQVQPAQGD